MQFELLVIISGYASTQESYASDFHHCSVLPLPTSIMISSKTCIRQRGWIRSKGARRLMRYPTIFIWYIFELNLIISSVTWGPFSSLSHLRCSWRDIRWITDHLEKVKIKCIVVLDNDKKIRESWGSQCCSQSPLRMDRSFVCRSKKKM